MILFTADWHFKLGQKNVPKEWALNRYNLFFDIISNLESDISLHVIGGDIFDRVPSMEELQLYFQFIRGVKVRTIIFDGNHEATRKYKTFFTLLAEITKVINPLVEVVTTTTEYENFTILPYCDLHKKGAIEACNPSKALMTHVRGEIPPHVVPEVDLERFDPFPVVYTGDLHSHSNTQRNLVYPGSPMTIGFHRTKVKTGGLLIDPEDMTKWEWIEFKLPQLIRLTVDNPDDMVKTEYDHTIYELEGDVSELSGVKNSELLDKKVVKRTSVSALDLSSAASNIDEELVLYLDKILGLPKSRIDQIMKEHNGTISN